MVWILECGKRASVISSLPPARDTASRVDPAETVRAVLEAVRADDLDAAIELFDKRCVLRMVDGTFEGHDGVRRWREQRAGGGGPDLSAGEPEAVDDTHVLVPLTVKLEIEGSTQTVRATGVWTVVEGRMTEIRAVPGGRRMALESIEAA